MAETKKKPEIQRKKLTRKNKRMIFFSIIAVVIIAAACIFLITHSNRIPVDESGNPIKQGELDENAIPGDESGDADEDENDNGYSSDYDESTLRSTAWVYDDGSVKEVYMFNEQGDCFYGTTSGEELDGTWSYTSYDTGQIIFDPYSDDADCLQDGMHSFAIKNNNKAIKIDGIEYVRDDFDKWINYSMEDIG